MNLLENVSILRKVGWFVLLMRYDLVNVTLWTCASELETDVCRWRLTGFCYERLKACGAYSITLLFVATYIKSTYVNTACCNRLYNGCLIRVISTPIITVMRSCDVCIMLCVTGTCDVMNLCAYANWTQISCPGQYNLPFSCWTAWQKLVPSNITLLVAGLATLLESL